MPLATMHLVSSVLAFLCILVKGKREGERKRIATQDFSFHISFAFLSNHKRLLPLEAGEDQSKAFACVTDSEYLIFSSKGPCFKHQIQKQIKAQIHIPLTALKRL